VPDSFAAASRHRIGSVKQPFFIVGVGRVGSTLLARQLEPHPRVALTREARVADVVRYCSQYASLPAYHELKIPFVRESTLYGLVDRAYVGRFAKIFHRHAVEMIEEFYRETFAHKDFTHWGDKLPLPDTAIEMQQSYPHAKYVVLMRDPRDVCCSVRSHAQDVGRHVEQPLLGEALRAQTVEETAIAWRAASAGPTPPRRGGGSWPTHPPRRSAPSCRAGRGSRRGGRGCAPRGRRRGR
jgi:hypothetical protein